MNINYQTIDLFPIPTFLITKENLTIAYSNKQGMSLTYLNKDELLNSKISDFINIKLIKVGEYENCNFIVDNERVFNGNISIKPFNEDLLLLCFWEVNANKEENKKSGSSNPEQNKNEDTYHSIINSSTDSIFILQNGIIQYANPQLIYTSGYTLSELVGKNFIDFVAPQELKKVKNNLFKRSIGESIPTAYESTAQMKNGKLIDVEVSVVDTIFNGKPAQQIVLRNINIHQKSEKKYQNIIDFSPIGFYQTSRNGDFILTNNEFANILGYKNQKELISKNIADFYFSPEERERLIKKYDTSNKSYVKNIEVKFKRKDGKLVWILMTSRAIKDNDQGTLFYDGFIIDITERKKNEAELLLKDYALASSINAIGITDLQGKLVYVNDAALKMWEYSKDEIIGNSIIKLWNGNNFQNTINEINSIGHCTGEDIGRKKDGTLFDVQFSASFVKDIHGIPINLFGSFIDITHRKKKEKVQKLLFNLSKKSFSSITLKHYLQEVHHELKQIMKVDNFYIALYDKNNDKYSFPYFIDETEDFTSDTPIHLYKSFTNYVRETAKGIRVTNDIKKKLQQKYNVEFIGEPSSVWLGAPLIDTSSNEVIGVLSLQDYHNENAYSEDDLQTLEIIANSTGLFIERVKNLEKIELAKQAAEEGEKRYKSLFNDNKSVMLLVDPKTGKIVDANISACEFYGYTYDSIIKLNINQINTFSKEEIKKEMQRAASDSRNQFYFKHKLANGKIKDVEVFSGTVSIDGIKLLYSIIHDISIRKKAEYEVLKLNKSIAQSPVITIITNTNGNIQYVNKAFEKITGYSKEEAYGKNPRILKSGLTKPQVYKELWETVLDGKVWKGELVNRKKNGNLFTEKAIITALKDETGKIINLLALKEDITKHKKIEQEIARLYQAIDQSPSPVALTDLNGYFIYVNPKYCEISGYKKEELIGGHTRILKSGKQNQEFYKKLWDTIKAGVTWNGEIINKKKNGEIFLESVKISTVKNEMGEVTHYIKVSNDITEERKTQNELILAKEKAEESDRLKSSFLANMSHEIRTPMNGILGFTNLLLEPNLKEEEKEEYIKIINKSGKRMLNTVTDIVEISKIEAGIVDIHNSDTDIKDSIESIINFFQPESNKKHISLNLIGELPQTLSSVNTDKSKFDSVFTNLIKNAIKYTDSGSITVNFKIKDEMLELCVNDTGIGIPEHRINAIFNRFEQADISDTRAYQGSGLGLAISKSYIEMLGGEIWVKSEVDKGSQFYFTLPITTHQKNIKPVENIENTNNEETELCKIKLLIVEDDDISALYLKNILNNIIGKIIQVQTGEEAIKLLKSKHDFNLVLMDIKMPGIDGMETTKKIRQFNDKIYIIAQTAYAMEGDREKTISSGCNDYISKPINKDDILSKFHIAIRENLK